MRFTYDGRTYVVEFQREFRPLKLYSFRSQEEVTTPSTKPYTTVRVVELDAEDRPIEPPFRHATVGCHATDRFTKEEGRIKALRLLTGYLPKPMRSAVWGAYTGRNQKRRRPVAGV